MTESAANDGSESARIGTVLAGRFRIAALLGRGGMASVYLAEDESLGRTVAIKIFRRDLADGDDLQRQNDEIQLLAGLNHPSLVTLFDAATDETGNAFLVMELVDGSDLHSRLRNGPLDRAEAAVIGQHLAEALAYVHAKGVIHRDIKPGNILLPVGDPEHTGPQAKLADFGIARLVDGSRLTATGQVLGTAGYFSPEQALGEGITPASDVYSLGLVLLECLTGERAFPGSAVESMTMRLARDPDVPAELGDSWVGLLRGMTSRTPESRPTARDVSGVLARLAATVDSTLPYPAMTAQTEVFASPPNLSGSRASIDRTVRAPAVRPQVEATRTATQDSPNPQETPLFRRRLLIIAASVAVVLLVAWLAPLAVSAVFPGTEPAAPIEYPAVDGDLGTHLEQLQRSVEP